MTKNKIKIKLVNKILGELKKDLKNVFRVDWDFSIKRENHLASLLEQLKQNTDKIIQKDSTCLKQVRVFEPLSTLCTHKDWANCSTQVWKYIHQVFFIVLKDEVSEEELSNLKSRISENTELIELPMAGPSVPKNDLFSIVNEITGDLVGQMKGAGMDKKLKGMNPSQIMEALVSGKKINGVDFSKIITDVSKKVEKKLKEKNIDESQLESQVSDIANQLDLTHLLQKKQ